MNKFKLNPSFEEFGLAAKQAESDNLKNKINEIFESSIRADFDSIPEGPFKSTLPEISWISFVRPKERQTGKTKPDTINVVVFENTESQKNTSHTWTVSRNGTIKPVQPIPPKLSNKYTREEIGLEIVKLLEKISPSFIHLTDLDILPAKDIGTKKDDPGENENDETREQPIDPERLKFFRSLKDAEFISANHSMGLNGYVVIFFDNQKFVVVENEFKGNALFLVDLHEKLDMAALEKELSAQKKDGNGPVTKDDLRNEVEKRFWQPIADRAKTRRELLALGAQRIVHVPDTWKKTISQAIASKMSA